MVRATCSSKCVDVSDAHGRVNGKPAETEVLKMYKLQRTA